MASSFGPELCPKCKGLHYRRDPCIIRKVSNPVRVAKAMKAEAVATVNAEPEQVVQIHRPEPTTPKRGPGRPKTITDMRAYKAMKAREYRARSRT